MDAVVLAGQDNDGRLRGVSDAAYEALIPIRGRAMVDWVLDALEQTPAISRIRLVGPPTTRADIEVVSPGHTLFDNIERGLRGLPPDQSVLVATADIPLVPPAIVATFLEEAQRLGDWDMIYPIIPQASILGTWPGVQRTYFRFAEGVFTGGNLFLVRPQVASVLRTRAERLLQHRKSPIRLAGDIGYGTLLKFLVGRLPIAQVEARAGELLGIRGRALVFSHPEVGVDVDKPSDLKLVQELMEEAESGTHA
ncbi:MAG: nucleotidyltransferase family protein [Firmicutes bacterium]|nr:nucleotidyltransferase family protein [Bacillota bacterium]